MNLKQITITIPEHYYLELRQMADKHIISISELCGKFVVGCINSYLEKDSPIIKDLNMPQTRTKGIKNG